MDKKVDLRIWVVISSWNPLRIYFYRECYVRFSCYDYDPSDPSNVFSHLTNNMISKKVKRTEENKDMIDKVPDNMWDLE
jgi:tubulin monoglycylase TTLL3/8